MSSELLNGVIDEIEIRQIRLPKNVLRESLGPINELSDSIAKKGLLQPIVVRPVDHKFELVAGMRRLEACKQLGIKKVPCHVVNLDEREAFEVCLVENIQRKTLNPVEEARAFQRYVENYGYGAVSELGRRIGKSEEYVSQRLGLLSLPEDVQGKVIRQLITPTHAIELFGLDTFDQEIIAELAVSQGFSSKEVRKIVKQIKGTPERSASPFLYYSQDSLSEKRSNRVTKRLAKCITLFKMTLIRFDAIIDGADEDEWFVKEVLSDQRRVLHREIDNLLKLQRKIKHIPMT